MGSVACASTRTVLSGRTRGPLQPAGGLGEPRRLAEAHVRGMGSSMKGHRSRHILKGTATPRVQVRPVPLRSRALGSDGPGLDPGCPACTPRARSPPSVRRSPVGCEGRREGQRSAVGMPDSNTGWGLEPQPDLGWEAFFSGLLSYLQSGCGRPSPPALRGCDEGPGRVQRRALRGVRPQWSSPPPPPPPQQPGLGPVARGLSQPPTPRPPLLLPLKGSGGKGSAL